MQHDIKSLKVSLEKQLAQPPDKVSIVNLIDLFIEYAYSMRASDIHIEPRGNKIVVRFRIDGILHDIFENIVISKALHQEIISRIKVLSGLRTDEHNLPQDGRFKVNIEGFGEIDIRVSIMPTYYGENAILRILAETQTFTLEGVGFSAADSKRVKKAIQKPYGMILVSGPTGSGKTSTLYTILKKLNIPEASIITIEDPIEYSLEGTTQIQVASEIGLTFANGLRSILRQDPNIIMVGEIRDEETADIAINAALTGHLLLSTVHTNDAATTFPRLIDMEVPPFLVASTINVALAQRLVRKICEDCRKEKVLSEAELSSLSDIVPGLKGKQIFYEGEGCEKCNDSGYRGRIAIFEVLEVDDEIRGLIIARENAQKIKEAAVRKGMTTMVMDGLEKAKKGITTLEEILRVIYE